MFWAYITKCLIKNDANSTDREKTKYNDDGVVRIDPRVDDGKLRNVQRRGDVK